MLFTMYSYYVKYNYTVVSVQICTYTSLPMQVASLYDSGDIRGAQEASRKARQLALLAIGVGVVVSIVTGIASTISLVTRHSYN